jgi:hypothetical protein
MQNDDFVTNKKFFLLLNKEDRKREACQRQE